MLGNKEEILVEGLSVRNKNELFGRTSSNKVVNFQGPTNLIGKFVNVQITELRSSTLRGSFLNFSDYENQKIT